MSKLYLPVKWPVVLLLLCISMAATAQTRTVSGTVISSEDKSALPGVNIVEKGTTNGAVTDAEGKYSINVSTGSTLVYTFVGFAVTEIVVGERTLIDVTLATDITSLSEIVVVGYGTQDRKDVTGSIVTLGEASLNKGPIVNPLQQLTGKAAGVNINQVGNEPGVAPNVRIRGITSLIGGSDPLVVVDGIQGGISLLNQVPPSEIESIDILKDASATAIYGSRGAPGVILITTKKGKRNETSIEYTGTYSVERISKRLDMLDGDAYRKAATERGLSEFDKGGNTNWLDEISQTGHTQNHTLAFGGGTENFQYRASGSAILQEGVIKNSGSKNYIGRVQAVQHGLDNKLTLTYNLNIGSLTREFNGPRSVGLAVATRPTNPIYAEEGGYFYDNTLYAYTNPVARVNEIIDGDEENSLFGSFRGAYEIVDGLTTSAFGSWRKADKVYGAYQSRLATFDGKANNGIGERRTDRVNEQLLDLMLNYKKSFGKHDLEASFIYEWQKALYEGDQIRGTNFPNDNLGYYAMENAGSFAQGEIKSYKNDRTIVSFIGRLVYSFNDKYNLTASFRRDGSSVFGKNNKWGNFPSVSLAWRLSEETFIQDLDIFNNLKLRAGFGITGNQQGLGALNSVELAKNTGNTFFGGELIRNFAIVQNENPDLRWETREMYNAGIDFALFNSRLTGTIDYFNGETRDLLFEYTVPSPPFPFNIIKANVGTVKNEGLEVTLNYQLLSRGDLTVNLGGNFSTIRTETVDLTGSIAKNQTTLNTNYVAWGGENIIGVGGQSNDMSYLITGQPLGTFYLFKHAGIDAATGKQIVDDVSGDGTVKPGKDSDDRYIAGQALPKFYFGFTPSVNYKNIDVSVVLRGAYGHKVYNVRRAQLSVLSRLGQENVMADALSTNMQNIADESATDFWLEDGGFTRLENLTIGYRFNTTNSRVLNSLRLAFTSNNLFVITKYKGIDPEVRNNGDRGAGIDTGIYPRTRNYSITLNILLK